MFNKTVLQPKKLHTAYPTSNKHNVISIKNKSNRSQRSKTKTYLEIITIMSSTNAQLLAGHLYINITIDTEKYQYLQKPSKKHTTCISNKLNQNN